MSIKGFIIRKELDNGGIFVRLFQVVNLAKEYLILGVMGLVFIGIVYFIFFRKTLKNHIEFDIKRVLVFCMLFCYVIIVIGATIFVRPGVYEHANLHLFSSYIEAWNNYSKAYWRNIILNILMFVPIGFLLPLFSEIFKKFYWSLGLSFLFTFGIEITQYMTKRGIFEVDDILNNFLGSVIGYCLIMSILLVVSKEEVKWRFIKLALCILPIVLMVGAGFKIKNDYNTQKFGNLSCSYNYIYDMSNVSLTSDVELNDGNIDKKKVYTSNKRNYGEYNIISQKEAYDRLKSGKFNSYELYNINSIIVRSVKLQYKMDSKGFYQPVYQFECTIDGQGRPIFIPALEDFN